MAVTMIRDIQNEICGAIEEAYDVISKRDYNAFILLIGRAEIQKGLKAIVGTDLVMEYKWDIYLDETRSQFYINYLNKNYSRDGYDYPQETAINDITTEMIIYSHLWDSNYFMKSLYRIAAIIAGKGYIWESVLPNREVHIHFRDNVIKPLKDNKLRLGDIIEKAYHSSIRNAFAHSRYHIDLCTRRIDIRPKSGYNSFSFKEFQQIFLYSSILMNKMENYQEMNHNEAARKNTALTEPFLTPDGVKVQVFGRMIQRGEEQYPEFRLARIIE
ncbi:MAG: hypothetical protein J5490_05120 [Bacteroidales bacterium]|nr:hypothetical protein [Bacteroidales bacterium]